MNRQQKEAVISELREKFASANATFLINYRGLTVANLQDFRGKLRDEKGKFKVTKARLMKIAAQDLEGADKFRDGLQDQIGLVFALEEVPPIAKALVEFAKENEALDILSGFFESQLLSKEEIKQLASLPSRQELLAQLAGTMQAPMTILVHMLTQMLSQLVYVLEEVAKKQKTEA